MQLWVNAAQMKAADQYTIQKLGVPSLELMEHAAQACVQVLEDEKVDLSNVSTEYLLFCKMRAIAKPSPPLLPEPQTTQT